MNDHGEFLRRRITELRLQKKVSELKMSHDLGKSAGYIHQIASGRMQPSMDNFYEICKYFDLTPVEFWDGENQDPQLFRELMDRMKKLPPETVQLFLELAGSIPPEKR